MYIYIARQPIFNVNKSVEGYELLYRNSEVNEFDFSVSGDMATRQLLSQALLDFGMQAVTGDKKAYVNFTEPLLLSELPLLLDKKHFVIEILESVELNDAVLDAMRGYREQGYVLALDDYCGGPVEEKVLDQVDIVKMDFQKTPPMERAGIAREVVKRGKILLAEKIETEQEFEEAAAIGCQLFQGFYLSKPLVLKKKKLELSQATVARLFRVFSDETYNINELAEAIRIDAHLTYKLLQKMRTARYYRGKVVSSPRDALVRLGMEETRRWVILVLMQEVTGSNADEQMRMALVRAVFCEKMAKDRRKQRLSGDAFLVGIFSIMDKEEADFEELLSVLDVSRQACDTLLYRKDNELTTYLETALLYENHEWDQLFQRFSDEEMTKLQEFYIEAITYADEALSGF